MLSCLHAGLRMISYAEEMATLPQGFKSDLPPVGHCLQITSSTVSQLGEFFFR